MFRYIILNIIGVILFISTCFSYKAIVNEEAIPVRDKDVITSMDYRIVIDKKTNKNSFILNSSVIASIYHYKDINNIDSFPINLKIDNNSKYKYAIDSILLMNGDYIIREINYKDNTFELKKDDLNSKYFIKINLKRKYS